MPSDEDKRGAGGRRMSREDRRLAIIDAAIEVFAKKGFFGAKVSEIAETAGVADGTIYLYFKSKDELLISLFEERMEMIIGDLEALLAFTDDPREKLRRYIVAHLELVASKPQLMQVLTIELRQSARFIKEYSPKGFGRYLGMLGAIVEEGQRKGYFRKELDPGVFRRALFGAIDELSLEWILRNRDARYRAEHPIPDPRAVGSDIADFILRGLRDED